MPNIDEFLDYLELCQASLGEIVARDSENLRASQLLQNMEKFSRAVSSGIIPQKFDFDSLKKGFGRFFHPDVIGNNNIAVENPDTLFAVVYSGIEGIEKNAKSSNPFSFKTEPQVDNNSYRSSYSQESYGYEESYENDYDDGYDDNVITFTKLYDFAKDSFKALFLGIPYSEKSYEAIKERYEKMLSSLSNRASAILTTKALLEKDKKRQERKWVERLSNASIESFYNDNLSQLLREAQQAYINYNNYLAGANSRAGELKPQIDQEFQRWQVQRNKFIASYNELCAYYQRLRVNFNANVSSDKFFEIEEDIQRRYDYIKTNLLNEQRKYSAIRSKTLSEDKTFCELQSKVNATLSEAKRKNAEFYRYRENKEEEKAKIKSQIEMENVTERNVIDSKINRQSRKATKLGDKYRKTDEKLQELVHEYGHIYGSSGFHK